MESHHRKRKETEPAPPGERSEADLLAHKRHLSEHLAQSLGQLNLEIGRLSFPSPLSAPSAGASSSSPVASSPPSSSSSVSNGLSSSSSSSIASSSSSEPISQTPPLTSLNYVGVGNAFHHLSPPIPSLSLSSSSSSSFSRRRPRDDFKTPSLSPRPQQEPDDDDDIMDDSSMLYSRKKTKREAESVESPEIELVPPHPIQSQSHSEPKPIDWKNVGLDWIHPTETPPPVNSSTSSSNMALIIHPSAAVIQDDSEQSHAHQSLFSYMGGSSSPPMSVPKPPVSVDDLLIARIARKEQEKQNMALIIYQSPEDTLLSSISRHSSPAASPILPALDAMLDEQPAITPPTELPPVTWSSAPSPSFILSPFDFMESGSNLPPPSEYNGDISLGRRTSSASFSSESMFD